MRYRAIWLWALVSGLAGACGGQVSGGTEGGQAQGMLAAAPPCDETTPCETTYNGYACRSMNGGPYAWYRPEAIDPFSDGYNDWCNEPSDVGVSWASCAQKKSVCADPTSAPHWFVYYDGACLAPVAGALGSFFEGRNCTGREFAFEHYDETGTLVSTSLDGQGCLGAPAAPGTTFSSRWVYGECEDFGGAVSDIGGNHEVLRN